MPSIRKSVPLAILLLGSLLIEDAHGIEVRKKLMNKMTAKSLALSEGNHNLLRNV